MSLFPKKSLISSLASAVGQIIFVSRLREHIYRSKNSSIKPSKFLLTQNGEILSISLSNIINPSIPVSLVFEASSVSIFSIIALETYPIPNLKGICPYTSSNLCKD